MAWYDTLKYPDYTDYYKRQGDIYSNLINSLAKIGGEYIQKKQEDEGIKQYNEIVNKPTQELVSPQDYTYEGIPSAEGGAFDPNYVKSISPTYRDVKPTNLEKMGRNLELLTHSNPYIRAAAGQGVGAYKAGLEIEKLQKDLIPKGEVGKRYYRDGKWYEDVTDESGKIIATRETGASESTYAAEKRVNTLKDITKTTNDIKIEIEKMRGNTAKSIASEKEYNDSVNSFQNSIIQLRKLKASTLDNYGDTTEIDISIQEAVSGLNELLSRGKKYGSGGKQKKEVVEDWGYDASGNLVKIK